MNDDRTVTSAHETPVYFSAGGESLFGIITTPRSEARGVGAVILSGGGTTAPATNRNRLSVHLARMLAAAGYHSLRFDYHGIGESTGVLAGAPKVYEPYLEDLEGALDCLRAHGVDRFVLIGECFGARTALSYAPDASGIEALVLIAPPLRDMDLGDEPAIRLAHTLTLRESFGRALRFRTLTGLFHPTRRRIYRRFVSTKFKALLATRDGTTGDETFLSPLFVDPAKALSDRGVPVTFIYGTSDWHYRDFMTAREGRLDRVLEDSDEIDVVTFEGEVHGLTHVDTQKRIADLITSRLSALPDRGRLVSTSIGENYG
jgi:pimeloyl-ACP methyl ester carboxylesterase